MSAVYRGSGPRQLFNPGLDYSQANDDGVETTLNIDRLNEIGFELATIVRDHSGEPVQEMPVDPALYAILCSAVDGGRRQLPVHVPRI